MTIEIERRSAGTREGAAQSLDSIARELRDLGWSYSQIAKALGVSKATVINYLRGYRREG